MIRQTFNFSSRTGDMIDIFQNDKGYKTRTAAVEAMIAMAYEKSYPQEKYKRTNSSGTETSTDSAELVCVKKLGGKVVDGANGKVCQYFTYDYAERYEQEVPMSMVNDDLIQGQYEPSRAEVEELQAKGKVNY